MAQPPPPLDYRSDHYTNLSADSPPPAPSSPTSPAATGAVSRSFSRYRSVRKKQSHQDEELPPPLPHHGEQANGAEAHDTVSAMNRSKSRYRHQRPSTSAGAGSQDVQQVPHGSLPRTRAGTATGAVSGPYAVSPRLSQDNLQSASQVPYAMAPQQQEQQQPPIRSRTVARPTGAVDFQPDARQLLAGERERMERIKIRQQAEQRAQLEAQEAERRRREKEAEAEAERERVRHEAEAAERRRQAEEHEQRRRGREEHLALKQRQREQASRRAAEAETLQHLSGNRLRKKGSDADGLNTFLAGGPVQAEPMISPKGGLFGMFKRRKAQDTTQSTGNLREQFQQPTKASEKPKFIKQGGGGIVPGTDAPVSAVNAGDRRVRLECNNSYALLPLTPETTPQDLIKSATNVMSEPIEYSRAFLLENFVKVGLQRPLRRYEHVRDILNSWDDDNANTLLIMHSTSPDAEAELAASRVPKEPPAFDAGWPLTYSQKPGKWDKRYITLDAEGQLWAAKNETGKDNTRVCHLSDFDIYSPTAKKAKKVKPPRKFCYAIKSQQKSTMFMNTTSFVHFFCSGDKSVSESFYRAVQSWRSWYLVNVMGEGKRKTQAMAGIGQTSDGTNGLPKAGSRDVSGSSATRQMSSNTKPLGHLRQTSLESHYQLGSFKPLLDLDFVTKTNPSTVDVQPAVADSQVPIRRTSAGNQQLRVTQSTGSLPDDAPLHMLAGASTHALYARNANPNNSRYRTAAPPSAFKTAYKQNGDRPTSSHSNSAGSNERDSDTFASNGLLGNAYSQRRRDVEQGNSGGRRESLDGGTGAGLQRNASTRSRHHSGSAEHDGGALGRTRSVRGSGGGLQMPKPLVDLTPQYKEPPQFQKKGKGYGGPVAPGGLVESATSGPQDAIVIPPSSDWRGRNGGAGGGDYGPSSAAVARPGTSSRPPGTSGHGYSGSHGHGGGVTDRTKSLRGHGVRVHIPSGSPGQSVSHSRTFPLTASSHSASASAEGSGGFTGAGLLASAGAKGWGDRGLGQGVVSESQRRGGPMLDMNEDSRFQDGSLLRRVEREGAGNGGW